MHKNDNTEEEQRFNNELKKLKLQAETGAEFFSDDSKEIPSNVESQFLDHIAAFEKAAERKEYIKLKEVLGNPDFPSPGSLTDQNVSQYLEKAYALLNENNIALDVLYEVPDEEIYRFIVEDLFDYDMSVIDIPDLVTHFTYEEFYPNDEEDLKKDAKEFISMLDSGAFEFMEGQLNSHVEFQGQRFTSKEFVDIMADLMNDRDIDLTMPEVEQVAIEADRATVTMKNPINHKYDVAVNFINQYGYWYMCGLQWPGL